MHRTKLRGVPVGSGRARSRGMEPPVVAVQVCRSAGSGEGGSEPSANGESKRMQRHAAKNGRSDVKTRGKSLRGKERETIGE
eukprot:145151-Pleurochrysis_carterae.AAC.1